MRHRAGQSQIPGERGCRDAGRRLLWGGRVYYTGQRFELARRLSPTPSRWWRRSLLGVEELLDFVPEGCTPVLVDRSGATPLPDYVHPERAFYIFGPEDGTLEPPLRGGEGGHHVPTQGCMNLATSSSDRAGQDAQNQRLRASSSMTDGCMHLTASVKTLRAKG